MESYTDRQENLNKEQDIDIIAIVVRLWAKRMFIFKVIGVFVVIGLFVAFLSPKEYSAGCVVVPETKSGAFASSSINSLAAIAGFNLGASSGGEMISPLMYDKLIKNINFRKELMATQIDWEGYDTPISILDYYTDPLYKKFSLLGTIKKYTIGLPSLILKAIRSDKGEGGVISPSNAISAYTKDELNCIKAFAPRFSVFADKKNGDVTIYAQMPEPVAAAQVAEAVKNLLQKYVIELKLQKADVNYQYIKRRYEEAKIVFEDKRDEYAKFQDANKVLSTALSKAKEEQIRNEFNVAKNLFSELTTQLIQAEMKIKEDIPILTVVEPVQIPLEESKPNKKLVLAIWCFMGLLLGAGAVLSCDWLKDYGVKSRLIDKILE